MINQTAPDTTDELEETSQEESAVAIEEIKKKSVSGAVSYFGRTLFLQGLGFASMIVLSALLEPADFGVYGFVTQIFGLLTFVSDIGLAAALIQAKHEPTVQEYRTVFTVQQLLSWLIMGIVLIIIASGFVQAKTGIAGVWILLALGISFPLASLKTISSIRLERNLNFSTLVIPHIVEQIVFHGLLIYLAWQGAGALAYAYAIFARSILGTVVMFWLEPWPIGFALHKPALKQLLGYGLKFQANDLLARIKDNLFFLALGLILPLKEFGYIQWAKMWSMYPYNLTVQNIMAITFPTFARLQNNKKELARAIEVSLFFVSLVIFPLLVGMSVFIAPLLQVFPQYAQWEPTIPSFILFTLGIAWAAISTPLTNTLNAIGAINTSLQLMVFWTIATWIITPICLYFFGFHGVAIASFIIACTSFIPVLLVKKRVAIQAIEALWRQGVAGLVMGVIGIVLLPFAGQNILFLLGAMVITGLSYCLSFGILGYQKTLQEYRYLRAK